MAAIQQGSAPGVMCLRSMNPYVASALSDWQGRAGHSPLIPRGTAASPQMHASKTIAGAVSIGLTQWFSPDGLIFRMDRKIMSSVDDAVVT